MKKNQSENLSKKNQLFAIFFYITLAGLALSCKPNDKSGASSLASDQINIKVMLEDDDLNYIDRSSMQAFLVCDDAEKRYQVIVRNNRTSALRGLRFRTNQEIQPGVNCQVEVHGMPRLSDRKFKAPRIEWLSQGRVENLLYISKPAPIMTEDDAPSGLGKGFLTTIFYKTFVVQNSGDSIDILPSELISSDKVNTDQSEELVTL